MFLQLALLRVFVSGRMMLLHSILCDELLASASLTSLWTVVGIVFTSQTARPLRRLAVFPINDVNPLNPELNSICYFLALLRLPTISAGERPAAAHLLKSWVRIPPGAWIFVCCECRVLSGRGLCDELITPSRGVLPTVLLRCVWSRNIKNMCFIYIYDISSLMVNDITLILLTWRKWWANNASK